MTGEDRRLEVRAIFFDAVGTLIHPEPAALQVYEEIGRRHGSCRTAAEIRTLFRRAFRHEEEADRTSGWHTSEDRERNRWQTIVTTCLNDVRTPEACFVELFTHFAQATAWRCEADAGMVLAELARGGWQLGMASNYDRRLRSVVADIPALAPVQHLVISSEVGWRKPAPEFFRTLCERVDCPPEQILFVGDDRTNDYEGARQANMHVLLFDPEHKSATQCNTVITNLSEILRFLPNSA